MKIIKKMAKWFCLVLLVIVIAFTSLWLLNAPDDLADNSASKARLDLGSHAVGKMDLQVVDLNRPTPAMAEFEGSDKRTLNGTIWFPESQSSQLPLIVYSHGFGGRHNESRHIAKYLARNGYIVAAVDFPLSNMQSPAGVPQLLDVVNQPGDVSAIIDHMLTLNNDSHSKMYNKIDPDKIGAMGLSLGGLTTALVSFHPDLKDSRIKAAAMMAPPLEGFSDLFYAGNQQVESLLMSGSFDRVVPESVNATEVKGRHPNGWFISMNKATHLGFANVGNPLRWMENPDNLGCAIMDYMLARLDLPERWDAVIPNTDGVLRDIVVAEPCPDLGGQSMNGLQQQWLTRIALGSFFDMHLQTGDRAESAASFLSGKFVSENPTVALRSPL